MTPNRRSFQHKINTNGNGEVGHVHSEAPTVNHDPADFSRIEELVGNVLCSRNELFQQLSGRRLDIDGECDYPTFANIELYRTLYDRDPIARRVVEVLPKESWQMSPLVYEDESAEQSTPFEEAWDNLGKQLAGHMSWHKDEIGSMVWEYLLRADIQSGIGTFGGILLGIDDGRNLQDPVDGVEVLYNGFIDAAGQPLANAEGTPVVRQYKEFRNRDLWQQTFGQGDSPATEDELKLIREYDVENKVRVQDKRGEVSTITANSKPIAAYVDNYVDPRDMQMAGPQRSGGNPGDGPFIRQPPTGADVSSFYPQNPYTSGQGNTPGSPLVPGTDRQYQDYGIGQAPPLGYQGTSPLGTDQQYFSVQFGPSEEFAKPSRKQHKLLFMRVFDESLVQVVRYEWNIRNPRFGQPVMYRITLNDPRQPHSGVGLPLATVYVHWSRFVHVADSLQSSEIFGTPRMQPCLNAILDLKKVRGGSAQMYWQGAFPGLSVESNPQMGPDVEIDIPGTQQQIADYYANLKRALVVMGMTVKSLAPQVSDPTAQINVQTEAICIAIACPVRVFKGSERGEQASSQDDSKWNDRLRHRQLFYITPRVIVAFIDRCIAIGVLPEPQRRQEMDQQQRQQDGQLGQEQPGQQDQEAQDAARTAGGQGGQDQSGGGRQGGRTDQGTQSGQAQVVSGQDRSPGSLFRDKPQQNQLVVRNVVRKFKSWVFNADTGEEEEQETEVTSTVVDTPAGYSIEWPDLDSTNKLTKSQIASAQTMALSTYIQGGIENLIAPPDFLTKVMQFSEEEAAAILANTHQHLQEVNPEVGDDEVIPGHGVANPEPQEPPPPPMQQVQPGHSLADEEGNIVSTAPGKPIPVIPQMVGSPAGGGGIPPGRAGDKAGGKEPFNAQDKTKPGGAPKRPPTGNTQNSNPNHDSIGRFTSGTSVRVEATHVDDRGLDDELQWKESARIFVDPTSDTLHDMLSERPKYRDSVTGVVSTVPIRAIYHSGHMFVWPSKKDAELYHQHAIEALGLKVQDPYSDTLIDHFYVIQRHGKPHYMAQGRISEAAHNWLRENKQVVINFNPNHDDVGRFSNSPGGHAADTASTQTTDSRGQEFDHHHEPAGEQGRGTSTEIAKEQRHSLAYKMYAKLSDAERGIADKITTKINRRLPFLSRRYGEDGTRAIVKALEFTLPIPMVPSLAVLGLSLGIAEASHQLHKLGRGKSNPAVVAVNEELEQDVEEMANDAQDLVDECYDGQDGRPPELDRAALIEQIKKELSGGEQEEGLDLDTENHQFFAECDRDGLGHCLPEEHGGGIEHSLASEMELKSSRHQARKKARSVTQPTAEEVAEANRRIDQLGAEEYESQIRGSSYTRRSSRERLVKEFSHDGGHTCPCVYCGLKLDDSTVTRDKIITARKGGRYRQENLVPSCLSCNMRRGDVPFEEIKWK